MPPDLSLFLPHLFMVRVVLQVMACFRLVRRGTVVYSHLTVFCLFVFHVRPMCLNLLRYQSRLLQRCYPGCGHTASSHFSPVLGYNFLSRCKSSTLTPRQPMVIIEYYYYLLAFSRFPLRNQKSAQVVLPS